MKQQTKANIFVRIIHWMLCVGGLVLFLYISLQIQDYIEAEIEETISDLHTVRERSPCEWINQLEI